jgi:polysaccharide export outer membrane protein
MKKAAYWLLLLLSCFAFSCGSYKNVPYFQNGKTEATESINNFSPVTIQSQDILGINVISLNPEASAIFNTNQSRVNGNNFDINPINPINGYLVDEEGNIKLPLVGLLKVSGLTTAQAEEKIYQRVAPDLKDATVTVRLMNFKITILGDVEHPGVYPIANERVTIIDALGMAGDLNITAERKNVQLIREVNGERKYITIDLTSKSLFTSSYYYLKNNDAIYVQPGKLKYAQVNRGGFETGTLVLSALSIIAIVFSTLHK